MFLFQAFETENSKQQIYFQIPKQILKKQEKNVKVCHARCVRSVIQCVKYIFRYTCRKIRYNVILRSDSVNFVSV